MFKQLTDFSHKRTALGAFGFYLAYLFFIIVAGMLLAAVLGLLTGMGDSFEFGVRIGAMTAIVVVLYLAFAIVKAKDLLNDFGYILLILLSGVCAFLGGGLLGLIPVAFLTTREGKKKAKTSKKSAKKKSSASKKKTPRKKSK